MGVFKRQQKFYQIPRIGRPHIPLPVLFLIGALSAAYLMLSVITYVDADLGARISGNLVMSTNLATFSQKPWTILTSIFVHQSPMLFLANMVGILLFGNLTAIFFSKRVVAPLFISGGLIGSASIWVFKYLPLTHNLMIDEPVVAGASGGMMTLAILASFYMPEQMIRLYGVFPLKLKFIGRAILLFSIVSIFFQHDEITNFLHLGGALGGYIFLVMLKRHRLAAAPLPFFSSRKKVWESAKVEMNVSHNKPIQDHEYNEIQVNKKEYVDHLLDKISRNGMGSLSGHEIDFLNRFSKE